MVSPALRGDGRVLSAYPAMRSMFPPRYAGMEGHPKRPNEVRLRFPRATRGWKSPTPAPYHPAFVSPALRGDGRRPPLLNTSSLLFPPRYAGMEGARIGFHRSSLCFPRATRGLKGDSLQDKRNDKVSPALRGDGSEPCRTHRFRVSFPPRYAGMEGQTIY